MNPKEVEWWFKQIKCIGFSRSSFGSQKLLLNVLSRDVYLVIQSHAVSEAAEDNQESSRTVWFKVNWRCDHKVKDAKP